MLPRRSILPALIRSITSWNLRFCRRLPRTSSSLLVMTNWLTSVGATLKPMVITRPALPVACRAVIRLVLTQAASMETVTPYPSVSSWQRAGTSSFRLLITSVAPFCRASCSLASSISDTMIFWGWNCLTMRRMLEPRAPEPMISTVSSLSSWARLQHCTAMVVGSIMTASVSDRQSGTR